MLKDTETSNVYDFSSLSSLQSGGAPAAQSNLNRVRRLLVKQGASESVRVERSTGIIEVAVLLSSRGLINQQNTTEGYRGLLEPKIEAEVMPFGGDDGEGHTAQEVTSGENGQV